MERRLPLLVLAPTIIGCALAACAGSRTASPRASGGAAVGANASANANANARAGTASASAPGAPTETGAPDATAPWWRHAVVYEIYPRSFQDSDGDGIGDLRGVTSRLDYLADLGVDTLWLTPFYPSPQVDFGYDVSDYENVDPQFGTLADFDRLVHEAHQRGMRILTDLVLNHTSDKHPWFVSARSSRTSPYRDYYVWHDPVRGGPPNNWYSWFEPSAWTREPTTGQFYYHMFYAAQPDLNWRNPAVEKAMFDVAGFWLARGVDGFRLDAVDTFVEDPRAIDNPVLPTMRQGSTKEHEQELRYNFAQPENHDILRRLRAYTTAHRKDSLLVSESYFKTPDDLVAYYGPHDDEVQLPFNFSFLRFVKNRLDAAGFRDQVGAMEEALHGRWTTMVLSNHDVRRAIDRYGDGAHDAEIAKLLATMLLTLRGTPFVYYGEELGMPTTDPARVEDVRDPVGKRYWPGNKGRDGERTPMQWDATPRAGFTTGAPWLPVPDSSRVKNVAVESADARSILTFYRQLLRLRRSSPALLDGAYAVAGDPKDPARWCYVRATSSQKVLVCLNMAPAPMPAPTEASGAKLLLRTGAGAAPSPLAPYEAAIWQL